MATGAAYSPQDGRFGFSGSLLGPSKARTGAAAAFGAPLFLLFLLLLLLVFLLLGFGLTEGNRGDWHQVSRASKDQAQLGDRP